jgi:hypothetical protein
MFRIFRERFGQLDSQTAKSRRSNRHQQGLDRLAFFAQIFEPGFD